MKRWLFVLMAAFAAYALDDYVAPNTFYNDSVIYAADFNENNDSLEAKYNRLQDSIDIEFVRYTDLQSGDSTLSRLNADTLDPAYIRGNPNIDSISGGTYWSTTRIDVSDSAFIDTLASNVVNIDGGAIDGAAIGANSASTGAFTTINANGNAALGDAADDDHTANGSFTINPGTQAYKFDNVGALFTLQSQTSGQDNAIRLYTKDGDATDNTVLHFYVYGTPEQNTTVEGMRIKVSDTKHEIYGFHTGRALTPMHIYANGSDNQLILHTNGNVSMAGACTTATINTGSGDFEIGQSVLTTSDVTFGTVAVTGTIDGATINTGGGDFEIGQDLETTSDVTFGTAQADSFTTDGSAYFDYEHGSFVGEFLGFSSTQTDTIYYQRLGRYVTIFLPEVNSTSNSTDFDFEIDSVPAGLVPTQWQYQPIAGAMNNASVVEARIKIHPTFDWQLSYKNGDTYNVSWENSNPKGIYRTVISYYLD